MDFGSSFVYSGTPYYSDVPKDDVKDTTTNENIYERVSTLYQSVGEQSPSVSPTTSPIYDPVYESSSNKMPEYDEVPFETVVTANRAVAPNPKPNTKRSLSSSMLQLAMKAAHPLKGKKNKPRRSDAVADSTTYNRSRSVEQRIDGNKPLPPLPLEAMVPPDTRPALPPPRIPPKPKIYHHQPLVTPNVSDAFFGPLDTYTASEMPVLMPEISQNSRQFKSLYPSLPGPEQKYEDIVRKSNQSVKVASAPPMSPPNSPSAHGAISAPQQIAEKPTVPSKVSNVYAAADTNVVSVKLGILQQAQNSMVWAMPPVHCTKCEAVLLHHALSQDQGVATCRFCGNENPTVAAETLPLVGNESDITYVINQQAPMSSDDSIIIFCIDTSGSMCVTSEVQASNSCFMSRLQGVREGILSQLRMLKREKPKVRVALITFSNMVTLFGDGSPGQYLALDDAQLYDTDFIKTIADHAPLPDSLCNSYCSLETTLNTLKEHGGTALGPALLLSVAVASKKFGSQVILCTDGRANVGVGSLESECDYKVCHNFYKETSEFGIRKGVIVSVLSIEGTDCRLVELGKVAGKTAGKVKIVDCAELAEDFGDVLSSSLMATNVLVNVVTQKELFFHDSTDKCKSLVKHFVGNATPDTEVTFKYGITDTTAQSALFQLQVQFFLANGSTCLRILTQSRPVTENRIMAEEGLNPAVVGTYASQLASRLALDGYLMDARIAAEAHKKLIGRALSIRSTKSSVHTYDYDDQRIYGSACSHMDDLETEIGRVVNCVKPAPPTSSRKPDLPPRIQPFGTKKSSTEPLAPMLPLPDVPDSPITSKQKFKEAVENCPDEVANKLFKHRNACGKMFTAF